MGFEAKGVRATFEALSSLPTPAIAHLVLEDDLQHYVVLLGTRRSGVRVMDPADGRHHTVPNHSFRKRWTGVAVLMAPGSGFSKAREVTGRGARFWRLVRPHRSVMLQALLGAAVHTALGLSMAVYVQKIVDYVLVDGNANLLNLLTLVMLLLLLAQCYIGWTKSIFSLRTAQQIDAGLIVGYYRHLLKLPQQFFDTMRVGEIVSRVNDAVKIRAFINDVSLELAVNVLVVAFSLGLMLVYSWPLALGVLCTIPLYALIFHVANRFNRHALRRTMEGSAELESHLVESVSAIATIRRYELQSRADAEMERRFVRVLRPVLTSGKTAIFSANASDLVSRLAVVGVLWAGARLVLTNDLTPGELMSFYALVGYLTGPATQLVNANRTIQDALIASDRLFEIMDLEAESGRERPLLRLPRNGSYGIRFEEVTFRYGTRAPVIRKLSLELAAGRTIALVGESGSGKSTIISLAQGIYPIAEGRILIGDYNLREICPRSLRSRFVVVPQEVHLLAGTVIDTIAAGDPDPDMMRILEVAGHLGITEFVDRLPQGFHTEIGENGATLSGGQRQRLAIARALYRDPEIIAFDEATSNLDSISESYVKAVIAHLRENGKTVILIAHRLSSVAEADRIVLIHEGEVAEAGRHDELMRRQGRYARLWRTQQGSGSTVEPAMVPATAGA